MRLLLSFFLLVTALAKANDGAVTGIGGRWHFMTGEHKQVQMVRERVQITITNDDSYRVVADFVFRNHGPRTVVTMGFPESGNGDIDYQGLRHRTAFKNFESWVDDSKVNTRRQSAKTTENTYSAFWIKTVSFSASQTRRVRVSYRAPFGHTVLGPSSVAYEFTGANWQGEVEESILTVDFLRQGTFMAEDSSAYNKATQHWRSGNRFVYRWQNWQANSNFKFDFTETVPDWLQFSDEAAKMNISNPRRGAASNLSPILPVAMVRNGITLIDIRTMAFLLHQHEKSTTKIPREMYCRWNPRTGEMNLIGQEHKFSFWPQRKEMQVDERQTIALPMAPFKAVQEATKDTRTYVPLRPILNVLGAEVRVDAQKHTFQILWPGDKAKR